MLVGKYGNIVSTLYQLEIQSSKMGGNILARDSDAATDLGGFNSSRQMMELFRSHSTPVKKMPRS